MTHHARRGLQLRQLFLKYRLIDMPGETELAAGEAERVGPKTALPGCIHHTALGGQEDHTLAMPDHGTAFLAVM